MFSVKRQSIQKPKSKILSLDLNEAETMRNFQTYCNSLRITKSCRLLNCFLTTHSSLLSTNYDDELKRLNAEINRSKQNSDALRVENDKLVFQNNDLTDTVERLKREIAKKM